MNKRTHTPVLAGLLFLFLAAALLICPGNVKAAGKTSVKNTTIRLSKTVFTYNGKVQKPAVTVTYRGKKLKVRKDYTLTYSKGRKNPGFYTVTVKGTGSYTGTVKKTFRINPVGARLATMTSPAGGTTLKLTWKRPSRAISGYQIRYSTRKDFKSAKVQTLSGATKLTTTLRRLKPGTRYYLEIRTFYRYTKTKSIYSAWSRLTAKTTAKKAGSPSNGNTSNGNTNNNGNPLWKSQMVLALGVEHSRQAAESQREVTDMTNELLKKNAQTLKMATIETAKESERGIVDIETLKQTNESLISTLDEVLKIQAEGHEKRQAAEAEMQRLEDELKNKLLEIRR